MKPSLLSLRSLLALLMPAASSVSAAGDPAASLTQWLGKRPGGAAMAVVDEGGVHFHQAGRLSATDDRAITPDTQWEIGSVTKVFTGILLAQSELAGKVSRNDPAAKYLLPADDKDAAALEKITLTSLTTHTSGLPRLPGNMDPEDWDNPYADYTRENLLEALRKHGPKAKPTEHESYSNFGASLLGEALAAAWQTSYQDALTQQVLQPLGLKQTTVGIHGTPVPDGFAPALGKRGKEVLPWTFQSMAAAGAIRSSTREMALFLQSCLGFREAPAPLAESMKPLRETKDIPGHIGMGWFITAPEDGSIVWHNGATGGFQAFLGFSPKKKMGVVILTNSGVVPDQFGIRFLAE